ncbi:MAG TPA: hypothetical protein VNO30_47880 [Kofleriaceae bacterium]|nr:hypothetical protein [Kofleriaceae bacterium]
MQALHVRKAPKRALLAILSLAFAAACSEDGGARPKDAGIDASGPPDASCFENPQTHAEIINACTTAQKVLKKPNLPLLQSGGALPPLPP